MRKSSQRASQIETLEKMLLMSASGIDGFADAEFVEGLDAEDIQEVEFPVPFAESVFADLPEATEEPLSSNDAFLDRVIELTNNVRAANGLEPLTFNSELQATAQLQSVNMAEQDFFSHTGQDGLMAWDRALNEGYDYQTIGENIAAGQLTPEEVVQAWVDSPSHLANILNPRFTEIGVGYEYLQNDSGVINYHHYWTQVFGTEFPSAEEEVIVEAPQNNEPAETPSLPDDVSPPTDSVEPTAPPEPTEDISPPPEAPAVEIEVEIAPPAPLIEPEAAIETAPEEPVEGNVTPDNSTETPNSETQSPPVEAETPAVETETSPPATPVEPQAAVETTPEELPEAAPDNNIQPPADVPPPFQPEPPVTPVEPEAEAAPVNTVEVDTETDSNPEPPNNTAQIPAADVPAPATPAITPPANAGTPTMETTEELPPQTPVAPEIQAVTEEVESQNEDSSLPSTPDNVTIEPEQEDNPPATGEAPAPAAEPVATPENSEPVRIVDADPEPRTTALPASRDVVEQVLDAISQQEPVVPSGLSSTNLAEVGFFSQAAQHQSAFSNRSLAAANTSESSGGQFFGGNSWLGERSNGQHSNHIVRHFLDGSGVKQQDADDDFDPDETPELIAQSIL